MPVYDIRSKTKIDIDCTHHICSVCQHVEKIDLADFVNAAIERFELSPREDSVVRLMLKGLSNEEVGSVLEITEKTVKHHVNSIFNKFRVSSRAELFHTIFPT